MSGKQTEVVQSGIRGATTRLDSSHGYSTNSHSEMKTVRLRQNTTKWAVMAETQQSMKRSQSVSDGLNNAVDQIIKTIEDFKTRVEQTRDEFADTDEARRSRFAERISSVGGEGLDKYDDGSYDKLNEFGRLINGTVFSDLPLPFGGPGFFDSPRVAEGQGVDSSGSNADPAAPSTDSPSGANTPSGTPSGGDADETQRTPNGNQSADL